MNRLEWFRTTLFTSRPQTLTYSNDTDQTKKFTIYSTDYDDLWLVSDSNVFMPLKTIVVMSKDRALYF